MSDAIPPRLVVTGTDTGIGKTVLSALLTLVLDACYWKPVQSGLEEETDSEAVMRMTGLPPERIIPEAYRLTRPLSPDQSAAIDGIVIDRERLVPPALERTLVIEGAGGLMVPLSDDLLQLGFFATLDAPLVLAVRSGLGTLNHTLLSLDSLRWYGLECAGIVMIGEEHRGNRASLERWTHVPVVGVIPPLERIDPTGLLATYREHFMPVEDWVDGRMGIETFETIDIPRNDDEWIAFDSRHCWHPYTQMQTAPAPIPIVEGKGAWLVTADGRRLLDAISSWWVTTHGHGNLHIARAIAIQSAVLEQVIFAGFTHEPAARLAAKLAAILPGDIEKIFYSDDGSTAVEVALKMCIGYWGNRGESRSRFLALEGAYHGDTFGAMAVSARSVFTRSFERHLFAVTHLPFPNDEEAEQRMLAAAEREMMSGEIAGVIVEPMVLGAGGMRFWRAEALAALGLLCQRHGIPLIADEVMTGFGRTGRMFAVEHASLVPDIITLSKGLSGGSLPIAVTACRPHIYEAFLSDDRAKALFHGHSFTANPIGCAASLASLEIFEQEPVMERLAMIGSVHAERLAELARVAPIRNPRHLGTIAAFELPAVESGYLSEVAAGIVHRAIEHGYLLRPLGDVLYIMPPYCITPEDLHGLYDFLTDELRDRDR